jgi:hypothetical protein
MNSIGILALILAVLGIIKLIFILVNPKGWMKFAQSIYRGGPLTIIVMFILTIVVGFYLFETMGIIEVAAAMLFTALLTGLSFAFYPKFIEGMVEGIKEEKNIAGKFWFPILIWIVFLVWLVFALFCG